MRWVTSDLHMFHKNILKFTDRPYADLEYMHYAMLQEWNHKVHPNDEVYILGDVSFGSAEKTAAMLSRMTGRKFLIKGNHDQVCKQGLVKKEFEWTKDYFETSVGGAKHKGGIKVVMFHFPINAWNSMEHGSVHLHGHLHSVNPPKLEARRYDVGVDGNTEWLYELDALVGTIVERAPARVRRDNITLEDNYK